MSINSLYYMNNGKWEILPLWGQLFFDLGYSVGSLNSSENRVVAGLALPTRAYAASLTAMGVVAGKLSLPASDSDALIRFQQLTSLTIGTSLIYRKIGRVVKCRFDGIKEDRGCSMIWLNTPSKVYKLPPSLALQVEIPTKEFTSPPKRSDRRTSSDVSPFLSLFLGTEAAKAVTLQSEIDCIIIGSLGRLKEEVNETQLAVKDSDGAFVSGTFQDILRVRRFSSHEAYRSDIYHVHSNESVERPKETPLVTIFDGATSFLKSREIWHHSHHIALFDQTEPEFDAGVQAFNEDFIKNHLDDMDISRLIKIPVRIPLSIYLERRK